MLKSKKLKYLYTILIIVAITIPVIAYNKEDVTPNLNEVIEREFQGEGMVVAIIDSGADIKNPAFKVSNSDYVKINEEKANDLISKHNLPGKYINEKIPYVFDYYHNDQDIYSKDPHGMHVAGIVGSNSDIRGVAPECQLLLMKVFPDSGINSYMEEDSYYVRAINDAITLGADVINLSMGAGAGAKQFVSDDVKNSIKRAKDAGIVVNIAAGNNGYYGFSDVMPKASNPDYGVIAMPGILEDVNTIASMEGDTSSHFFVKVSDDYLAYQEMYKDGLSLAEDLPYGKKIEAVNVGYGSEKDYKNKNVKNRIVIAMRGKYTFRELQKRAAEHEARGIIILNNENVTDELFQVDGSEFSIPMAHMKYDDGKKLIEDVNEGNKIIFLQDSLNVPNPKKNQMSSFSAWGPTNDGTFKPDITAPGGNILSLGNDGSEFRMSGTSMSTPYISGISAIILQRLNETYLGSLDNVEKLKLANRILLSSAKQKEENNVLVSPRKQGVGVVDIKGIISSQVIAYADEDNIKLNLGNVKDSLKVSFYLENISKKPIELKGKYSLLTDEVKNGRFTMKSIEVKNGSLGDISLKPLEKKKISYEIPIDDVNLSSVMKNGYFLDGFIHYDYDESKAGVSMAFTSFKGNFDTLDVLEEPIYYMKDSKPTYYDDEYYTNYFTHLGSSLKIGSKEKRVVLGEEKDSVIGNRTFDKYHIAFSPNKDNRADSLDFVFTALRTYEELKIDILDESNNKVETYEKKNQIDFLKNYYGADINRDKALILWSFEPRMSCDNAYTEDILSFLDEECERIGIKLSFVLPGTYDFTRILRLDGYKHLISFSSGFPVFNSNAVGASAVLESIIEDYISLCPNVRMASYEMRGDEVSELYGKYIIAAERCGLSSVIKAGYEYTTAENFLSGFDSPLVKLFGEIKSAAGNYGALVHKLKEFLVMSSLGSNFPSSSSESPGLLLKSVYEQKDEIILMLGRFSKSAESLIEPGWLNKYIKSVRLTAENEALYIENLLRQNSIFIDT